VRRDTRSLGGLWRRHAELGQEAAVVGLHPFLGQPALVVVPEGTDRFPLEVLPSGLDRTDSWTRGWISSERWKLSGTQPVGYEAGCWALRGNFTGQVATYIALAEILGNVPLLTADARTRDSPVALNCPVEVL
jgi:hypothetical protein